MTADIYHNGVLYNRNGTPANGGGGPLGIYKQLVSSGRLLMAGDSMVSYIDDDLAALTGLTLTENVSISGNSVDQFAGRFVGAESGTGVNFGSLQAGDNIVSMLGVNDLRAFGPNIVQYAHGSLERMRAAIAFIGLPASLRKEAGDRGSAINSSAFTFSGSWTAFGLGSYDATVAAYSTGQTSYVETTVSGSVIVVGYATHPTSSTQLMDISVDGVVAARVSGKRWLQGSNGANWNINAIVLPGFSAGSHTVRVANTVNGQIGMVWFVGGFNPSSDYLTNIYLGGALKLTDDAALTGSYMAGGNIQSAAGNYNNADANYSASSGAYDTITDADAGTRYDSDTGGHVLVDQYNRYVRNMVEEFRGYGYQIAYVPLDQYDPLMGNDGVHPAANPAKMIARLFKHHMSKNWAL